MVSVGDGIARVYGYIEIQVGEMVEFGSNVKEIVLNLYFLLPLTSILLALGLALIVCLFCQLLSRLFI